MRIVRVVWHDSFIHSNGGWEDLDIMERESNDDTFLCHSVGYLAHESNAAILLVSTLDPKEGRALGGLSIPRSAIQEIVDIDNTEPTRPQGGE